jgi:hypothetical protein
MAQIKLNFSRLSIPEKIARARQIVTAMTGNARFSTPQPPLAAITTATNELEQAAGDVQAARHEAIIQSAGMDVRAAPGASAIPAQPQALGATAGDHDGQMDLSWDPVISATSYVIEFSPDPPTGTSWKHLGVSTKSSFTVTDLVSGSRVWFRVAAVNAAGQSGWSDPATKIVP